MAHTKVSLAILLLAMIFSHITQSIEGRNIKIERNDFLKPRVYKKTSKTETSGNSEPYTTRNAAALEKEPAPAATPPSQVPPLSRPPPPRNVDGHSPGIGHSVQN
ncbi:hypothetical protein A4A49_17131 [Nicotiana attenuata]|uniref:Uncharacterized protein n=1 Tax=Nicotiana attenuata TaxID=49451 RepID=A0A314LH65_NICAT|nr:hypothetical protein A4A49_17131 [Nicotiana attenuata]